MASAVSPLARARVGRRAREKDDARETRSRRASVVRAGITDARRVVVMIMMFNAM